MKKLIWTLIILIILGIGARFVSQKTNRLNFMTITNSIGDQTTLVNPASVFCTQNSGTSEIITNTDGSQSGLCHLSDGTTCDEWAYFRGECLNAVKKLTGTINNEFQSEQLQGDSYQNGQYLYIPKAGLRFILPELRKVNKVQNGNIEIAIGTDYDYCYANNITFNIEVKTGQDCNIPNQGCLVCYTDKNAALQCLLGSEVTVSKLKEINPSLVEKNGIYLYPIPTLYDAENIYNILIQPFDKVYIVNIHNNSSNKHCPNGKLPPSSYAPIDNMLMTAEKIN